MDGCGFYVVVCLLQLTASIWNHLITFVFMAARLVGEWVVSLVVESAWRLSLFILGDRLERLGVWQQAVRVLLFIATALERMSI